MMSLELSFAPMTNKGIRPLVIDRVRVIRESRSHRELEDERAMFGELPMPLQNVHVNGRLSSWSETDIRSSARVAVAYAVG